jgi:hypothetical protein
VNREPAMIAAVVAAIALLVGYSILTPEQGELWKGVILALLPLFAGLFTRSQVAPMSKLTDAGISAEQLNAVADNPDKSFQVVNSKQYDWPDPRA